MLGAHEARAQTQGPSLTGILGAVQRCEPDNPACGTNADSAGKHPHPHGVLANTLNLEDCVADLYYEFEIGVANPSPSYALEAWVGTQDCSQLANRQTSVTSVCWPVAPFQQATNTPFLLDVRMQDIASGAFTTTHPVVYSPTTDPSVCQEQTQTGPTSLTLYLFFVDGGANTVGSVQAYPITLDERAGDVQGNISVAPGDGVLVVAVPRTTDPDTQGYNVYCDGPAAATSHADAGDTSEAGVSPAGSCESSVLTAGGASAQGTATSEAGAPGVAEGGAPGVDAFQYGQPSATKYLCGSAAASAATITVAGLKNDVHYSVAVAAVDAAGNVGPLSNVACGEPFAGAGGTCASGAGTPASACDPGGGRAGSCATENAGAPGGTSGLGVLMLASIAAIGRRRKRA
jgi:MYXO-CTERM domain-containing protein